MLLFLSKRPTYRIRIVFSVKNSLVQKNTSIPRWSQQNLDKLHNFSHIQKLRSGFLPPRNSEIGSCFFVYVYVRFMYILCMQHRKKTMGVRSLAASIHSMGSLPEKWRGKTGQVQDSFTSILRWNLKKKKKLQAASCWLKIKHHDFVNMDFDGFTFIMIGI